MTLFMFKNIVLKYYLNFYNTQNNGYFQKLLLLSKKLSEIIIFQCWIVNYIDYNWCFNEITGSC